MKLLLFSDTHNRQSAMQSLVEQARHVDLVIGAGDFCNARRGLQGAIDVLSSIETPTIVVPGNSESDEELRQACRNWPYATVLHGNGTLVDDLPIYGIGGGIPVTPFGAWSFDFDERQAATLLADLPPNAILVSHSPPKGAVDVSSRGRSLGSTTIRAAIEKQQPRLVVCGHIHDSAGRTATIGPSTIINAGPNGVVWEL